MQPRILEPDVEWRRDAVADPGTGRVRHLKRLWLETSSFAERPPYVQNDTRTHWEGRRSISRLDRRA